MQLELRIASCDLERRSLNIRAVIILNEVKLGMVVQSCNPSDGGRCR
jgi:hypothetical protein